MTEMNRQYCRVMTIAGSDSGGGAGIQADLKTISALGCYGASAITAVTVQNTRGVTGIHGLPPDFVYRQIRAVLDDIGSDAVKIGMLHAPEIVEAVARALHESEIRNVVLDPVMVAASGDKLIEDATIDTLIRELFPLVDVLTPNLDEAAVLLDRPLNTLEDMRAAAPDLLRLGSRSVLVKGGHLRDDQLYDLFVERSRPDDSVLMTNARIETNNIHGSGCTLSSAIAVFLARGQSLQEAVKSGVDYTQQAILAGKDYQLGRGSGPLNHFFKPAPIKG